jgi:predicted unusual protein kinase regulating ubiquinone biosynthesis (AarF/ABC1/UbiB family)
LLTSLFQRQHSQQRLSDIVEQESVATGITIEVEELQKRNRDSFQIPEWFLYSSRAFLTLEGVSLQANPNFSLIQACFPYVAKRLVADDDPRARKALRDLLYGASDSVDVERLAEYVLRDSKRFELVEDFETHLPFALSHYVVPVLQMDSLHSPQRQRVSTSRPNHTTVK